MSVINQMLRDLDRRHSPVSEGLPQYLRPVAVVRGIRSGSRVVAVLAVSVAVGAGVSWWLKSRHGSPANTAPGAPAIAEQTGDRGTAPRIASGSGAMPSELRPTFAAPILAPLPPAAIERSVPNAPKEIAAPERLAPSAVASPREPIKEPAKSAADSAAAPKAPPAVGTESAVVPAIFARQTAAPSKPATVAAASAQETAAVPAVATDAPDGPRVDKRLRDPSLPAADAEFRQAVKVMNQGRVDEAMARLRAALELSPAHQPARQTLVALLVERRSLDAAERELEEGLRLAPEQIGFASLLARLMVERDDVPGALAVLERHAAHASTHPQYRGFRAALLQRAGRHAEAVQEFRAALAISPNVGPWWMGLGISEQALGRRDAASAAFRNARASGNLSPELVAFVEQRLRQLQ